MKYLLVLLSFVWCAFAQSAFSFLQQEWIITRSNVLDYSTVNKIIQAYQARLPSPVYDVWVQKQQFTSVLEPKSQDDATNPNDNPDLRTTLYFVVAVRPVSTATVDEIETLRRFMTSTAFTADFTKFLKDMFKTNAAMYRTTPTGTTKTYPASCQDRVRTSGTQETDVDCGGVDCDQCYGGSSCRVSTDCFSLRCKTIGANRYCEFWGLNTDTNAAPPLTRAVGVGAGVVLLLVTAAMGV